MNMTNLVKQAQKMQKQMEKKQEELMLKTIDVSSGGGVIKIVITGKKEIKEIKIDPEIVDKDDVESLEDLIISAVNEAVRQADDLFNNEMSKISGGVSLPF